MRCQATERETNITAESHSADTDNNMEGTSATELWDRALLLRRWVTTIAQFHLKQRVFLFIPTTRCIVHLSPFTSFICRELALAVSEENFSAAARLQEALASVLHRLPPACRALHANLETLRDPSAPISTRRAALYAVAASGGVAVLPDVCALLGGAALGMEAEDAAAAIRARAVTPEAADLCRRGSALLVALATGSTPPGWTSTSSNSSSSSLLSEKEALGATAAALFTSALEEDSGCVGALAGRAAIRYKFGRYEDAIEDLQAALAIDPWHAAATHLLAISHAQLKQFEEAKGVMHAAAVLNPGIRGSSGHAATLRKLRAWEEESAAWQQRYQNARQAVALREAQTSALEKALAASSPVEGVEATEGA